MVMIVEELLETMCKWKEEYDTEAQKRKKMVELTKHLSQAEEALKTIRAEWDGSPWINEDLT